MSTSMTNETTTAPGTPVLTRIFDKFVRIKSDESLRSRLESQGYLGHTTQRLRVVQGGIRFAPATCAVGIGLGTLLASPAILFFMAVVAGIGAVTPRHPGDYLWNSVIRRFSGDAETPQNDAPRRAACGVGAVWVGSTATLFAFGLTTPGLVLGGLFAVTAAWVALTHICPVAPFYALIMGDPRKQSVIREAA